MSPGWTALVYACSGAGGGVGATGAVECARRLLVAGARVDGAPARGDDVCTLTPLQVSTDSVLRFDSCTVKWKQRVVFLKWFFTTFQILL